MSAIIQSHRLPLMPYLPVISLVVVALTALIGSNIENKANFLNRLFIAVYLMAIITFMIQMMQSKAIIDYKGWVIARGNNGGRYDGNFGQANHAGYAFVLSRCVGDLSTAAVVSRKVKCPAVADGSIPTICAVWLDAIVCDIYHRLALTQSRAGLVMMLAVIPIFFWPSR